MTAVLRHFAPYDIDAVLEIERASFPEPWSPAMFLGEFRRPDRIWLVAEGPDGSVVGYGGVMIVGDEAHLMNLAVASSRRRCGIGRMLYDDLAVRAARAGARRLTLEVRDGNDPALGFYRAAGLAVEGVRPGYYRAGQDALIMWGELPDAERRLPPPAEIVLAIETSCDETAAAVMRGGSELLSSVVASQVDFHARFGGVVPEIASRKHTRRSWAWSTRRSSGRGHARDLDAIAVTHGPRLIGALVVGSRTPRARVRHRAAARRRQPPRRAHLRERARRPRHRAAAHRARRLRRPHLARPRARVGRLPHPRRDARRRGRRGVRQGREGARPRVSGRPGHLPPGRGGRSGAIDFPGR
jgi:ribosomal-protein-alanine acetyltransferase